MEQKKEKGKIKEGKEYEIWPRAPKSAAIPGKNKNKMNREKQQEIKEEIK